MNKISVFAALGVTMLSTNAISMEYDGSWTNSYEWTELSDQTVTSAPIVPTIYRGTTEFKSKVGGNGFSRVLIFSGGAVNFSQGSSDMLIYNKGDFRLAVVGGAMLKLSARQHWYSDGGHFELVDGIVSGEGGICLGGQYDKNSTIDIYGGRWTAPVITTNGWSGADFSTSKVAMRVYGGVFAPSSLLPTHIESNRRRRSNVLMAGGTFICPSMKMSNNKHSVVTWFASEAGTDSVLKLKDASVTWAGQFTLGDASLVRLQQNVPGREECLSIATNIVGSGEIRIEGVSLDLSDATCDSFTGMITLKSGKLELGSGKRFGEGSKIVLDYPERTCSFKAVSWTRGAAPEGVTFILSDALKQKHCSIEIEADGVRLLSNRGFSLVVR